MLKDAFGQAAKAIIGALSKDTSLSKVKDSNKRIEEVRSGLTELVPNAWEPILEKYRGSRVVIERKGTNGSLGVSSESRIWQNSTRCYEPGGDVR